MKKDLIDRVEELPSGSYRFRKMIAGKTYQIVFDHKPKEKEIERELAEIIRNAPQKISDKSTFESCARDYVDNKSNILSPASIRTYNELISRLSDNFKTTAICSLTQEMVQKEINDYTVDHAPKTVRSLHGFIASVLKMYRPQFVLNTTLPRRNNEKTYTPSSEDIRRILEAVKGTEYSIPFQLGVLGLRRGEICALTLSDLDGQDLTINKTLIYNHAWILKHSAKTDESNRTIRIPEKLAEEIRENGKVFEGDPKRLNLHLQKYQKRLGIPQFRFHDLRHYFASYASTLGVPEADIMAMGGWKSDHVFKSIYRDSLQESRLKNMDIIGNNII